MKEWFRRSGWLYLGILAALLLGAALPAPVSVYAGPSLAALRPYLAENTEQVILQIRRDLVNHEEAIHISFMSKEEDASFVPELIGDLLEEALSETDSPVEGDYIRYQYGGYAADYSQTSRWNTYEYDITIKPVYYTTMEQEKKTDDKVREILDYLNFSESTPEAERVRAIYRYLWQNISYDHAHLNTEEYHLHSTAYAALVNRTAVCQGYSVTLYRLLKEAGLSCRIIAGKAEDQAGGEGHAWNIVRVDGLYYNLDVTWASNLGREAYFLEGSEDFDGHIRDPEFETEEFLAAYPMSETSYPAF